MLTEEITKLAGKSGDIRISDVDRLSIRRYADAVGDQNPLYWKDEYAKNSRYGSLIAPPGFFGWPSNWTTVLPSFPELVQEVGEILGKNGFPRVLDGGIEYDFFVPVRSGDTLSSISKVKSLTERETKGGSMVFLVVETTYSNQNGELVAKVRGTTIHR